MGLKLTNTRTAVWCDGDDDTGSTDDNDGGGGDGDSGYNDLDVVHPFLAVPKNATKHMHLTFTLAVIMLNVNVGYTSSIAKKKVVSGTIGALWTLLTRAKAVSAGLGIIVHEPGHYYAIVCMRGNPTYYRLSESFRAISQQNNR